MKIATRFAGYALALSLVVFATAADASSVTLPSTFTQGSVISSSEMNENFSAVKAAVDDSQAQIDGATTRITDLEAAKQNRIAGNCAAGSSIGAINADGTVTCVVDRDTTYTAASPLAITGTVIGLEALGISNSHISPTAAIAASKIFGDAGIEFSAVARVDLPNNSPKPTLLTSITLKAPSAGTILVMVNGGVNLSDTHMLVSLGIGTSKTEYAAVNSQWASGSSTTILPFSVPAAGNYAFFALANESDPANQGTSWITDVHLVGLFVPKRY